MYLKKICKRKLECILKMLDSFISLTRPFLWSSHWCSMPMSHEQLVQSTVGSKNHWKGHNVENSYKDVPLDSVVKSPKLSHFPFLSLVTYLVTLFNRKLKVVKNSSIWPFFGIFIELLSTGNVKWDFFCDFQTVYFFHVPIIDWLFRVVM